MAAVSDSPSAVDFVLVLVTDCALWWNKLPQRLMAGWPEFSLLRGPAMVRKRGGCRPLSRVNRSAAGAENQSPPGDAQRPLQEQENVNLDLAAWLVFWGVL